MRHPFDGIIVSQKTTRRSWLGAALAAAAGLIGLGSRALAVAPPARTVIDPTDPEPKPKLTQARGEAGVATRALNEAATQALNEQGAMTRALNENGIGPHNVTTLALNEEGAKQ
jgi:hypothetical protein